MVRRADADLDAVREQLAQLTAAVHDGNVQPEQILPQEHEVAVRIQTALQEKCEAMEARLIALEAERKQGGELGGSRGRAVTFADADGGAPMSPYYEAPYHEAPSAPRDGAPSQVAPATPQPAVRAGGGGDQTVRLEP